MRIEGCDLIYLGQRHPHFVRQRDQMVGGQASVLVLYRVKMFDQQVTCTWRVAKEGADLVQRVRIELPTLCMGHGSSAAAWMSVSLYARAFSS